MESLHFQIGAGTVIPCTASHWAAIGRCTCGAVVYPDSFRDRASYREATDNQLLCQECQDHLFFSPSVDGAMRYPIRRGVIVAPEVRDGAVCEIGLLPFLFVAPECDRIAFEARFLLRAGPRLEPLDPWDALAPMREIVDGHQVRLAEVDDMATPEVRAALHVNLVVALDAPSEAGLDSLSFEITAPRAVLADVVHWSVLHSSAFLAPWLADPVDPSVLRTCALAGLALDPGGQVVPPLSYIVSAHRERFPELWWGYSAEGHSCERLRPVGRLVAVPRPLLLRCRGHSGFVSRRALSAPPRLHRPLSAMLR